MDTHLKLTAIRQDLLRAGRENEMVQGRIRRALREVELLLGTAPEERTEPQTAPSGAEPAREDDPAYFKMDAPALIRACWVKDARLLQMKETLHDLAGELSSIAESTLDDFIIKGLKRMAEEAPLC